MSEQSKRILTFSLARDRSLSRHLWFSEREDGESEGRAKPSTQPPGKASKWEHLLIRSASDISTGNLCEIGRRLISNTTGKIRHTNQRLCFRNSPGMRIFSPFPPNRCFPLPCRPLSWKWPVSFPSFLLFKNLRWRLKFTNARLTKKPGTSDFYLTFSLSRIRPRRGLDIDHCKGRKEINFAVMFQRPELPAESTPRERCAKVITDVIITWFLQSSNMTMFNTVDSI